MNSSLKFKDLVKNSARIYSLNEDLSSGIIQKVHILINDARLILNSWN